MHLKNIFKKYRPAQGLLETTIGLSLLITGVVSLLVVVVASSVGRSVAETQTVAANLARESIEVVRNIRDTNWIQGKAFNDGMVGSELNYAFATSFDPTTNIWSLLSLSPGNPPGDPKSVVYLYTADVNKGLMVQAAAPPLGTSATIFKRYVSLDPICTDGFIGVSGSECMTGTVGIRVSARVQWQERGRSHTMTVEERLYDWR